MMMRLTNFNFPCKSNIEVYYMLLLRYISIPIFLVSFAVGLVFVHLFGPEIKTIYVYPTPETVDKVLFKDKAGNCFSFEEKSVACPRDPSLLKHTPIQPE